MNPTFAFLGTVPALVVVFLSGCASKPVVASAPAGEEEWHRITNSQSATAREVIEFSRSYPNFPHEKEVLAELRKSYGEEDWRAITNSHYASLKDLTSFVSSSVYRESRHREQAQAELERAVLRALDDKYPWISPAGGGATVRATSIAEATTVLTNQATLRAIFERSIAEKYPVGLRLLRRATDERLVADIAKHSGYGFPYADLAKIKDESLLAEVVLANYKHDQLNLAFACLFRISGKDVLLSLEKEFNDSGSPRAGFLADLALFRRKFHEQLEAKNRPATLKMTGELLAGKYIKIFGSGGGGGYAQGAKVLIEISAADRAPLMKAVETSFPASVSDSVPAWIPPKFDADWLMKEFNFWLGSR